MPQEHSIRKSQYKKKKEKAQATTRRLLRNWWTLQKDDLKQATHIDQSEWIWIKFEYAEITSHMFNTTDILQTQLTCSIHPKSHMLTSLLKQTTRLKHKRDMPKKTSVHAQIKRSTTNKSGKWCPSVKTGLSLKGKTTTSCKHKLILQLEHKPITKRKGKLP